MKKTLILIPLIAISGCANQPQLIKKTLSGKPEGVYAGKTKGQVKDALVALCNNAGLTVTESTDSYIICGKQNDSVLAQMLVGNAYSTPAMSKVRFTISQIDNSQKVWADMWIESQMPGGQVNQMPTNSNTDRNSVQKALDNLKP